MNVPYTITRYPILLNDFFLGVAFGISSKCSTHKNQKSRPVKYQTAISKSLKKPSIAGFFPRSGQKKKTNNCINHWFSIWQITSSNIQKHFATSGYTKTFFVLRHSPTVYKSSLSHWQITSSGIQKHFATGGYTKTFFVSRHSPTVYKSSLSHWQLLALSLLLKN